MFNRTKKYDVKCTLDCTGSFIEATELVCGTVIVTGLAACTGSVLKTCINAVASKKKPEAKRQVNSK